MKSLVLITTATIAAIVLQNANYVHCKKGGKKSSIQVNRHSIYFCAAKFIECIDKGKKMRAPYSTTPKTCEARLHRHYFCKPEQIYRPIPENEKKKMHINSRSMNAGEDSSTEALGNGTRKGSSEEFSFYSSEESSEESTTPETDYLEELTEERSMAEKV